MKCILQSSRLSLRFLAKKNVLAHKMLEKVAKALSEAEAASVDASLIDRLDMMQMVLTEAAKENVCTNTKCQHYNKSNAETR